MNFFTDGIGKQMSAYANFLDTLISDIPEELLQKVLAAIPEIQPGKLTLHFQFHELPGRLTISMNEGTWEQDEDAIRKAQKNILGAAKVAARQFSITDLADLDYTITPEVGEWMNMQREKDRFKNLFPNRRRPMTGNYDGDFTMW